MFYHYRGFFAGMRRECEREAADGVRKAKRLLYAYRVALTGIHALLEGEIETRVDVLADAIICLGWTPSSRSSSAPSVRPWGRPRRHRTWLRSSRLERQLEEARERSVLPEAPPNHEALERFVVEVRLHRLCGGE